MSVQDANATSMKSTSLEWADFRFPPVNLWNVWPTQAMHELNARTQDPDLWDPELNKYEDS